MVWVATLGRVDEAPAVVNDNNRHLVEDSAILLVVSSKEDGMTKVVPAPHQHQCRGAC
jgi:hypothetical protein